MVTSVLSSREFNQDTGRAKKAAANGPVFITDRGRPSHVLLTMEDYEKLTHAKHSIVDMIAMSAADCVEIDFPRVDLIPRPVDFS